MPEAETTVSTESPAGFTPAEQRYFDSRGETGLDAPAEPKEAPAAEPAQSAPEGQQATQEAPEGEDKPRKFVEHGAFHEERSRRKALEAELQNHKIMMARMEERYRALSPQPQQPKPPPAPSEDIFGAVDHLIAEHKNTRAEIDAYKQRMAAEEQWNNLARRTSAQEEAFKKDHPDYDDAWRHLVESRTAEMRYLGANDQQIVQALQNDARSLMVQAFRAQKNPGELVYEFARQRGYTKKEAKAAADEINDRLDVIEAGQRASKSLSTVGGKAGGGEVTLSDIARMSDAEFGAFKEKNPAKWRRLRGGP